MNWKIFYSFLYLTHLGLFSQTLYPPSFPDVIFGRMFDTFFNQQSVKHQVENNIRKAWRSVRKKKP